MDEVGLGRTRSRGPIGISTASYPEDRLVLSVALGGFRLELHRKGTVSILGEADSPEILQNRIAGYKHLPLVLRLPDGQGCRGTLAFPLIEEHEVAGLVAAELASRLATDDELVLSTEIIRRDVTLGRTLVEYVAIRKIELDRWLLLAARWRARPKSVEVCGAILSVPLARTVRQHPRIVGVGLSCLAALACGATWLVAAPATSSPYGPNLQLSAEMVRLAEQLRAVKATRPFAAPDAGIVPGLARLTLPDPPTRPAAVRYQNLASHDGSAAAVIGWFAEPQSATAPAD
jgi:hypothetical protein